MQSPQFIELQAGFDPAGRPLVEKLNVTIDEQNQAVLAQSPAFIKGLAKGDKIKFDKDSRQFELIEHSGNLCIRVFCKQNIENLEQSLTSELEKLGGELDIESDRMLVYSIHVSCGFKAIEEIFERHVKQPDAIWLYGNVYAADDNQTPLNWWHSILKPE